MTENRYSTPHLDAFIAGQVAHLDIEARILRKIWKALKDSGDPIVRVYDGEEVTPIANRDELFSVAFNLDELEIYTSTGGWIRFVMGEEWDCLSNYTVGLDEALAPVNRYIDAHNG